jgi:signal transduction histidine kinase
MSVGLDLGVAWPEILRGLIAAYERCIAVSRTLGMKRLIKLWIAAVVLLTSTAETVAQPKAGVTAAQPKQILLLYPYGQNFQPWVTWGREIRRELNLQSPWPLDVQAHSLFTALSGDDDADAKFVEFLRALYDERPPDLIIALGGPSAQFVQQHRANLFPTTPMLLGAVNVRRVAQSMLSGQDAVVGTQVDHGVLFDNIQQLLPKTKTVAIIIGNSPAERFWVGEVQRELKPLLGNKVELLFFNERPFPKILEEVAYLPPNSAIFFQQMMVDGAGAVYGDKEPLRNISEVANAPIFTFDETFFSGEVVGGPMSSPAEGGRRTAEVAVRMLGGENASGIKVAPVAFSTPKYDWRQLQRWNISEGRLPPGSEVLFREQTPWEKYFWPIALIITALLLQAGLIAVLLHERHRRQHAEVQSRQRMAELAHVNRFSTAGELAASIAHEVNQPLAAILSNAEAAAIMLKSTNPELAELREVVGDILHHDQRAAEVIKRMRSLLKKAPFELKSLDLNDLARETVEFLSALARGQNVELHSTIAPGELPILGDPIQLQQVILNLVVNGIDAMGETPSEKRVLEIRMSRVERYAELSVSDRGPGIPADKLKDVFEPFFTTKAEGMGMGLSIARTIVEAHDGLISAKNRDNGGASLLIRLPLAR